MPAQTIWQHPTVLTAAAVPTVSALPNYGTSDTYLWQRANDAITLWGGVPGNNGSDLLAAKPGQPITIGGGNWLTPAMPNGAARTPMSLVANAPASEWSATSIPWQDGAHGNLSPSHYTGFSPNEIRFVANAPGVYTIQGQWDGQWGLPLVVAVGLNQLKAPAWPINGTQWATSRVVVTAALRRDPRSAGWSAHQQLVTQIPSAVVHVGHPVDGWVPVWGRVPLTDIAEGFANDVTFTQRGMVHGITFISGPQHCR